MLYPLSLQRNPSQLSFIKLKSRLLGGILITSDITTRMAKNEEKLKNLLMKVRVKKLA